jgi:hypothetical protein
MISYDAFPFSWSFVLSKVGVERSHRPDVVSIWSVIPIHILLDFTINFFNVYTNLVCFLKMEVHQNRSAPSETLSTLCLDSSQAKKIIINALHIYFAVLFSNSLFQSFEEY